MLEALIEIVRRAGDMVLSAHDIQNVTRDCLLYTSDAADEL